MQTLNREQAKDYLRQRIGQYLDETGRSSRKNFSCIRGTHSDKTPSMSLNPRTQKVKCFSGDCIDEPTLDIFDIIGLDYDLTNFNDQFNKACELYNVAVESGQYSFTGDYTPSKQPPKKEEAPQVDYTEFILEAHANINNTDYPAKRGLTDKSIKRFRLGYDANWVHPNNADDPQAYKNKMLIIPTSSHSYTARSVAQKFIAKAGSATLFNRPVLAPLYNDGYVFICEGEIDAMSLYELGIDAVAIGSTSNTRLAVDAIQELKDHQLDIPELYITFDNDPAGQKATSALYHSLKAIGIEAHPLSLGGHHKDINDFYLAEPEQLRQQLQEAIANPEQYALEVQPMETQNNDAYDASIQSLMQSPEGMPTAQKWEPDPEKYPYFKDSKIGKKDFEERRADIEANIDKYNINKYPSHWAPCLTEIELTKLYANTSPAQHLQGFINDIAVNTPPISTGFKNMNTALGGGLYEGLYFIGAISSLGKTTLALQIADQIAQNNDSNRDIIIFSLEMSRYEIMAKTISRLTYLNTLENGRPSSVAKTTLGITDYSRYAHYSKEEKQVITDSISQYQQFAERIYIHEGIGDIGVNHIRETIERHVEFDKKYNPEPQEAPIVIVDYLQILAPHNERSTDKQNTDKAVIELKRISRDFKTPVIAISSFNRQNYTTSVNMTAFKESGAIEYSADVVIGLQFEKQKEIDEYNRTKKNNEPTKVLNHDLEKQKEPREIQLKVLKNRNGITGKSAYFDYYAMFNHYAERQPKYKEPDADDFKLNIKDEALEGSDLVKLDSNSFKIKFD